MKSLFTKSGLVAPKTRRDASDQRRRRFFFLEVLVSLGEKRNKKTGVSELLTKTKSQIKLGRKWVVEISTAPSRNGRG